MIRVWADGQPEENGMKLIATNHNGLWTGEYNGLAQIVAFLAGLGVTDASKLRLINAMKRNQSRVVWVGNWALDLEA